ncbi:MAG: lactate utilization protein [Alphaproteobacteria bacterium]|jgi:L-lactate dehydrogenase complex protein LldG
MTVSPNRAARDQILGSIRRSLGRDGGVDGEARTRLDAQVDAHSRNIVPKRTDLDRSGLVDLFEEMATRVHATTARVASMDDVPEAVSDYLKSQNLPAQVVMAPDPTLDAAGWDDQKMLEIRRGTPVESDPVSVTSAYRAVAETGTLVMASGPDHPSTLNFMPETHVVVLPASRVAKAYEDVWDGLRGQYDDRGGLLPRTVNFITGPSRSGDIQQTLLLGAHGPRRLHIVLVEDGEEG